MRSAHRVQGVYTGCTTDAHRFLPCTSGEHPWYTQCTPLVHGALVPRERLGMGGDPIGGKRCVWTVIGGVGQRRCWKLERGSPEVANRRQEHANSVSDTKKVLGASCCRGPGGGWACRSGKATLAQRAGVPAIAYAKDPELTGDRVACRSVGEMVGWPGLEPGTNSLKG